MKKNNAPHILLYALFINLFSCGGQVGKKPALVKHCYQGELSIIYGNNDLSHLIDSPTWLQSASLSVAAVVRTSSLIDISKTQKKLVDTSDQQLLCDSSEGPLSKSVKCSSFLIASDIVLTAGHCIQSNYICKRSSFIFGLERQNNLEAIDKDRIYGCKEILDSSNSSKGDYSVIKLERKVQGIPALKLLDVKELAYGDEVSMIGYPKSRQIKISQNGKFFRLSPDKAWLHTQVDSLSGSSGSPIFDNRSQSVVGVHTHGLQNSLTYNSIKGCYELSARCRDPKQCGSSKAYNISQIPMLKSYMSRPFDPHRSALGCSN